jgi:hypothetical protein
MQIKIYNNLVLSILIVLLCSIVIGLLKYEIGIYFPLTNYSSKFATIIANTNAILTTLFVFITFLLVGSIAHLMAIIFDGQLAFKRLLAHIGYGFLPLLILSTIIYYFSEDIFYKYIILYENSENISLIKSYIQKDKLLQIFKLLNLSTQIFIFVWVIYGLKKIYQLTIIKAISCILFPLLLTFIFIQLFKI